MNTTARRNRWCAAAIALFALAGCNNGDGTVAEFIANFGATAEQVNDMPGAWNRNDPEVCCSGLDVYVVWEDDRNDLGGNKDIYVNYSRDGGLTWQANAIRLDTGDNPGAAHSNNPMICCDGQRVYVVWEDHRNDPDGHKDIYLNYSSDGGVTWQASDTRLDTDAPGEADCDAPRICCDGQRVYVVWEDDRNDPDVENEDIYLNYSSDGGVTWQTNDIRLDTDSPGAVDSGGARICCDGQRVYVVWSDGSGDEKDILFNYSADGGARWQSSHIRIDTGDLPGASHSDSPAICCDGLRVHIAWRDSRNDINRRDMLSNYSMDGGATWQANPIPVDNTSEDVEDPVQICCEGSNVYACWADVRDGEHDIFLNYSRDGGATWQSNDRRLDTGDAPGAGRSTNPVICCVGRNIHVTWQDERSGERDIYFNFSTDAGATWQGTDIRLDGGDARGANESQHVRICCGGGRVYVVWKDRRNDPGGDNQDVLINPSKP